MITNTQYTPNLLFSIYTMKAQPHVTGDNDLTYSLPGYKLFILAFLYVCVILRDMGPISRTIFSS